MKRRTFITLLGGAAAWPLTAHAQQATLVMALAKRSFKPQRLASVSYAVIARLRSSVSTQGRCIREIEGTWSGMRSLLKIGLAAGFAASNAASTSPRTRASFGYDAIGLQVGE